MRFPNRDTSLAGSIRSYSEPESGSPAENLISNEDSYTRVIGSLSRRAGAGGVFLGVGPDQNFSLMAAARPGLALIVDFRRRNALLHLVHKALFSVSSDRLSYCGRLMARTPEDRAEGKLSPTELVERFSRATFDRPRLDREVGEVRRYLEPLGLVAKSEWPEVATIQARLAGPGMDARFLGLPGYPTLGRMIRTTGLDGKAAHFLGSEDSYQTVRALQLADRILPIVGNFAVNGAMTRLANGMRELGIALSVVYVSDVEFFLFRAGTFDAYVANLAAFPRLAGALIVRTSTRPISHRERVDGDQCTTIARDLDGFLDGAKAGRFKSFDDLFRDG